MTTRTFFVCPAPPCPNGKLHLGHIGGVYLLTDLFVRFQRMRGHRAYQVTGADEHGTYTLVKARKLGRPVDEVAQLHIDEIKGCLQAMHIEPDIFVRTTDATHKQNSLKIFRELEAAGYIDVRDGYQLHCETCNEFVADSLAVGHCPACDAPTDSNLCENCGLAQQHSKLRAPRHTSCGKPLALRPIRQAFFDIPRMADRLEDAIGRSEWGETIRRKECAWLRDEAHALPMSRIFERGVMLETPAEVAGQTLMTWFEGLWCFDTGIRLQCARDEVDYDTVMRDTDTRLLFFMGQDNRFYYTIGVTGSLLARGYPLPANHSIQDFYNLEGEKFSTSRNHALWADEVSQQVDPSVLRYALARIAKPFGNNNNDFQIDGLIQSASHILGWENAIRRDSLHPTNVDARGLTPALDDIVQRYVAAMDQVRFWDALELIDEYFVAARFGTSPEAWRPAQVSVFLSLLHPVMPVLAARYGGAFFGENWIPALEANATLLAASPRAAVDFPPFGVPIADSFIRQYQSRFQRAVDVA
ncbi:class I tRNA ligase family protein [Paraburkholderia bryophila]|uniref:class I tRNA ligase family protein n=1 Tax=Paraburkholderia bryophila TaxID=420952 RepID=UPI00234A6EB1|nr:class I tRNA ligase family protein [Paraburkholderia bryophila]WCM23162.1 class I tRNA ligase family protein [Paraburkholderia bryophila]